MIFMKNWVSRDEHAMMTSTKGFKNAQKAKLLWHFSKRLIISTTVSVLTRLRYPRKHMKNSVCNNSILPGLLKPCRIWVGVGGVSPPPNSLVFDPCKEHNSWYIESIWSSLLT